MSNKKFDNHDLLPESFEHLSDMDRRRFLEYTLKLTSLLAASKLVEPGTAEAQSALVNAPSRFVNITISGGSCQLSNYLSPLANKSNAQLNEMLSNNQNWKVPGLATSFRPSNSAQAQIENVDLISDQNNTDETDSGGNTIQDPFQLAEHANLSQPLYHARTYVNGYHMPLLWSSPIPVGTVAVRLMKNLILNDCAMIYGLESSPAHNIAFNMLTNPEPGGFTIGGYIHYHSTAFPALFPAISSHKGAKLFSTPSGSGIKVFNSCNSSNSDTIAENEAWQVLNSLIPQQSNTDVLSMEDENVNLKRRAWLQQLSTKMNDALTSIKTSNMALKPGISALYDILFQAKQKVETKEYESVKERYADAFEKYKNLTIRATEFSRNSIQGITDEATRDLQPNVQRKTYRAFDSATVLTYGNPSDIFGSTDETMQDLSGWYGNSNIQVSFEMAHLFAFAEVALDPSKPLTNVLSLGFGQDMVRLKLNDGSPADHSIDNHNFGVVPNLAWGSLFYYVFNTLMYEFVSKLKGIDTSTLAAPNTISFTELLNSLSPVSSSISTVVPLNSVPNDQVSLMDLDASPQTIFTGQTLDTWKDTIIAIYTEFPRNPQAKGRGSDHAYGACNVTLLGGRLPDQFKVFGKTALSTDSTHPGAWGNRSVLMKTNSLNRYITLSDVGVSLAKLYVRQNPHPKLSTLSGRSITLFSLDPTTGTIVFDSSLCSGSTTGNFNFSFEGS